MADGQIKIIVGAAADRSVETVFSSIERRALRMRDVVAKALGGSGTSNNALGKPFENAARIADKSGKEIERGWNQRLAELNKIAKAQDRIHLAAARAETQAARQAARERQKVEREASRDIIRSFKEQVREAQRAADEQVRAQKKVEAERRKFAERTSHRAVRFLFPNPIGAFGAAARIGGDLMRAAAPSAPVGFGNRNRTARWD